MRQSIGSLKFYYRNTPYQFDYYQSFLSSTGKIIYFGSFLEDAPPCEDIRSGQEYCIHEMNINAHTMGDYNASLPQYRFYHDLMNFPNARNLRTLLLLDDTARKLLDYVRRNQRAPEIVAGGSMKCLTVEAVYRRSEEAMRNATAYERFDLLIQTIDGIQELQCEILRGRKDSGNDPTCVAHRDIKLKNILIQPGRNRFTAILIDFASMRQVDPNGTGSGMMAPSNTPPEAVNPRKWAGWAAEKSDVFAIGSLIGQLFGLTDGIPNNNPIMFWRELVRRRQPDAATDDTHLKELLKAEYDREYERERADGRSWLERALEGKFAWNAQFWPDRATAEAFARDLREVLYHAMRINPNDRIGLEALREKLLSLQARCKAERSDNANLYDPNQPADPHYVCMFDLSEPDNIPRYCLSARRTIPRGACFHALVYWKGTEDTLYRLASQPLQSDALPDFLGQAVREVMPAGYRARGMDGLLQALLAVADCGGGTDALSLSIFTPRVPADTECMPGELEDKEGRVSECATLIDAADCLRTAFPYGLDISLFSAEQPGENRELWYDWIPLDSPANPARTEPPPRNPGKRWFIKIDGEKRYFG